jgi:tetratricopeptide (TPR) repeat protein
VTGAAKLPLDSRLAGLSAAAIREVVAAAQALDRGRVADAERHIVGPLALYPAHPEVLRLHAGTQRLRGDIEGAIDTLRRAIASRPNDALYLSTLGSALIDSYRYDEAIDVLRQATQHDASLSSAWYNLGLAHMRAMQVDDAAIALRRALQLSPEIAISAYAMIGDLYRAEGRIGEAQSAYRDAISRQPHAGMAWWGLADLKTLRLSDDDVEQMRRAMNHRAASEDDKTAIGFALAKALDERQRYAESLDVLAQAHARARTQRGWNAVAQTAYVDRVLAAFTPPPASADTPLGNEAIFIVSLPRSGSTLIEQVLASHSMVGGGGELSDAPAVLTEEAHRLRTPFPDFVRTRTPEDWSRMGARYLERTARWKQQRSRFTDKLPGNWMYVGAIAAMLPAAKIVIVRRDPLETCFSCYRQRLAGHEYTRTFADLAATWRDFERAVRHWLAQYPDRVHEVVYETFVADPESTIRRLLDFCGLPFEENCLQFHKTERDVYTPSAAQVRQPLRRDTARSPHYGALLDPLRAELGLPPFQNP